MDGLSDSSVGNIVACAGVGGFSGYGSREATLYRECYYDTSADSVCIFAGKGPCVEFWGGIATTKDGILTLYKPAMQATVAFYVFTTLSVSVLCILTCKALCHCGPQLPPLPQYLQFLGGGAAGGNVAVAAAPTLNNAYLPQQQGVYVAVVAAKDSAVDTKLA
jgi:hypothetical protein